MTSISDVADPAGRLASGDLGDRRSGLIPLGYRLPDDREELLDECDVDFSQGPGPGGQHRNRSRTAVRLRHRPTGLTAVETRRRSRTQNLEAALDRLHARLAALMRPVRPRRATRPTRASRQRRLEEKKRRSRVKEYRRKVTGEE